MKIPPLCLHYHDNLQDFCCLLPIYSIIPSNFLIFDHFGLWTNNEYVSVNSMCYYLPLPPPLQGIRPKFTLGGGGIWLGQDIRPNYQMIANANWIHWFMIFKYFSSINICSPYESIDIKGKVHPKNMLVSDVRSVKIGKNAVDRFSLSPLVLKIFAFKLEKLLIWRQPFWYANEGDMTSQLQDWKLRKYHFAYRFWNIERNSKKLHRLLGVINPLHFN